MLTLWEPQRDLLTGARSPFGPGTRRMVLAESEYLEAQEPLTVWAELPAWPAATSAARR